MFADMKNFFDFCDKENRNKFYKSIILGFFEAMFSASKIMAAWVAIRAIVSGTVTNRDIWMALGIMVIGTLGRTVLNRYSSMMQTEGGYNTAAGKRMEIAEHLRYVPMGYFNDTSLGNITSVTTNTMEQLGDIATRAIMLILQGMLVTGVLEVWLLVFDVRVGLIGLAGIILFAIVNVFTNKSVARKAPEKISSDRDMVGVIIEYIQGISEVRNYNILRVSSSKIRRAIERKKKADIAAEIAAIPMVGVQMFVTKATGVAIAGFSLYAYLNGSMTLVNTILMLLCSYMLFEQLEAAGNYSALLRIIAKCVDMGQEVLAIPEMDLNGKDLVPENRDIHLEHVDFAYESRKIIDDMTLDIPEKTTTAIVGPSGGGKTTLTSLIARFWDVDKGEVTIGGRNVKDYSMDSLMSNFSFVFQRVYLFEDTIANNIRFGNPEAPMEDVIDAAKKASCHDFIMELPDGYETVIGEGGASLSGGEKQRISIARAIMKDAPIIILDEATANVDPENEKELTEAIENLTREKTVIMIAHRLKTVRHADQIIVVDKGRIVQKGTHDELMKQDGIYKSFVEDRKSAISWKIA